MSMQHASKEAVLQPVLPAAAERGKLAELCHALLEVPRRKRASCKLIGPNGEHYVLPESVFVALVRSVEVLERGGAVTIVPLEKQLTTQQAANILNISRPHLIGLLDHGEIPFLRTGSHRRLNIRDVLDYRRKRHEQRLESLRRLTELSAADDYFQDQ